MPREITIDSVMTTYPYSIEADAHVSSARAMLTQFKIRHLPVQDGAKWVGVISERHLQIAEDLGTDMSVSSNVRIRDLCRRRAYIVEPDELLAHVVRYMAAQYFDSVLVVKDGKLLGIFTFTDALKHYADLLTGK
jgi:acetoin utilization protein AcuB